MFRIFSICVTLLFSINLIQAQSGYEIKVKVNGFAEKEAYLAYHFGDKQYIKDTVQVSKDGYYTFSGQDSLKGGIYLFVMPPKNNIFQILVNDPHPQFTIETDTLDFVKHVRITNSSENELFRVSVKNWQLPPSKKKRHYSKSKVLSILKCNNINLTLLASIRRH